jgi:glycosidase
MLYKTPLYNYLINLLGSHDTVRCATFTGDDRIHTLMLVTTLLLDGMPLIYYGDEIAMKGEEDPDNRRAMKWNGIEDNSTLKAAREIGTLRRNSAALRRGKTKMINAGDRVLAFFREFKGDKLTAVINFSGEAVTLKGKYQEIAAGEGGISPDGVKVGAKKFAVLK